MTAEPLDPWPLDRSRWRLRPAARKVAVVLLWAVAGLLVARGLAPRSTGRTAVTAPTPIPYGAVSYAAELAGVWLTYDAAHPEVRARALARLAPGLVDGWDKTGTAIATDVRTTNAVRQTDGTILVTVSADVDGRAVGLSVNVGDGLIGWRLVGVPAVVPIDPTPAAVADVLQPDTAATAAASPTVLAFLRAWGSGSAELPAYLAAGYQLPPLGGLSPVGMSLTVGVSTTGTYDASLLVSWQTASGARITSGYDLRLVRSADRWTVLAVLPGSHVPPASPTPIPLGE